MPSLTSSPVLLLLLVTSALSFSPPPLSPLLSPLSSTTIFSQAASAAFRSNMSPTRLDEATAGPIRCVMKFGGSSLADSSRIDYVANLIKSQIAKGIRPAAVVCSAMGKTTNNLLNAGEFAMGTGVNVDAIRTLHMNVIEEFNLPNTTKAEVEVRNMREGGGRRGFCCCFCFLFSLFSFPFLSLLSLLCLLFF